MNLEKIKSLTWDGLMNLRTNASRIVSSADSNAERFERASQTLRLVEKEVTVRRARGAAEVADIKNSIADIRRELGL